MRFTSTVLAAAALLSGAEAAYKGFNYGAFFGNNQAKVYTDFKYEFEAAKELPGTNGQFTSARLYTMIQYGTTSDVIQAIQAAIDTNTQLLLGIWTSAGQASVDNEIAALKAAISQYGDKFAKLVVGISVGSEDLYRITPTAISNGETNPGVQPAQLVQYINQVRSAIKGTVLASTPIGHVDTWTAYVNASNSAVVNALDFLGVDAYPYYEVQLANSIANANASFYDAYAKTVSAANGKPVWVTETGWPVSGPQQNQAVASKDNARIYWEDVTCSLLRDNVNLFYYTLQDIQYTTPSPSFGIKPGGDLKAVKPLFDLSCPSNKPADQEPTSSSSSTSQAPSSSCFSTSRSTSAIPPSTSPSTTAITSSTSRSTIGVASSTMNVPCNPTTAAKPSTLPSGPMSSVFVWPPPRPHPSSSVAAIVSSSNVVSTLRPSTLPPVPVNTPATASGSTFPGYPQLDQQRGLTPPFIAPNLVVPIDSSDPNKVIADSFTAQLSPTRSTLFVFDVPPSSLYTCNLVFVLPPPFDPAYIAPMKLVSPGGITVSLLGRATTLTLRARAVAPGKFMGRVPALQLGNKYIISSAPCEHGQRVAYRIDALNGLDLNFFQTISPALGLFMEIS